MSLPKEKIFNKENGPVRKNVFFRAIKSRKNVRNHCGKSRKNVLTANFHEKTEIHNAVLQSVMMIQMKCNAILELIQ